MSGTIQAIETRYSGCRFRSRLEARWAVFFDTLRIPWEYESEGFMVGDQRYLPDFYLPNFRLYAEVKGDSSQVTPEYERMLRRLVLESDPDKAGGILLLSSIPSDFGEHATPTKLPMHTIIHQSSIFTTPTEEQHGVDHLRMIFAPTKDGATIVVLGPRPSDNNLWEQRSSAVVKPFRPVVDAYIAARSARFEHGEAG